MENLMTISLTDDADQVTRLRRKHAEYAKRVDDAGPNPSAGDLYKEMILRKLLDEGGVHVEDLWSELAEGPHFDARQFSNAVQVIAAYNANNTAVLMGGTGLV